MGCTGQLSACSSQPDLRPYSSGGLPLARLWFSLDTPLPTQLLNLPLLWPSPPAAPPPSPHNSQSDCAALACILLVDLSCSRWKSGPSAGPMGPASRLQAAGSTALIPLPLPALTEFSSSNASATQQMPPGLCTRCSLFLEHAFISEFFHSPSWPVSPTSAHPCFPRPAKTLVKTQRVVGDLLPRYSLTRRA